MRRAILIVVLLFSVTSVEAKKAPKLDSITIFGRVLCEGKPLANVPVSDGVHIVKTDSLGRYFIASNKFQNTVFVITPSGYEPECRKRILPLFWSLLRKKRDGRRAQFSPRKTRSKPTSSDIPFELISAKLTRRFAPIQTQCCAHCSQHCCRCRRYPRLFDCPW